MKIRYLVMTETNDAGDVVELDADLARLLIEAGEAEPADAEPSAAPEPPKRGKR